MCKPVLKTYSLRKKLLEYFHRIKRFFNFSGQSPRPPNESVLVILTEIVEFEVNLSMYIIIVIFTARIKLSN